MHERNVLRTRLKERHNQFLELESKSGVRLGSSPYHSINDKDSQEYSLDTYDPQIEDQSKYKNSFENSKIESVDFPEKKSLTATNANVNRSQQN